MTSRRRFQAGVDIGGTFTDIVLVDHEGQTYIKKVPSTPDDYARGIVTGLTSLLSSIGAAPSDVDGIAHATTVATNAILEAKGAKAGLITTAGFRDVLELRRARVPELYNLDYQKPAPLVARRLRLEVVERMAADGTVRTPLCEASVVAAAERLKQEQVAAVAVSLINAYANPAHEKAIARILGDILPPGTFITCSHDVLPEIREYERTSTTVVNAVLGPLVARYLTSLKTQLKNNGFGETFSVMDSNGGLVSARAAVSRPARILESGPAAGVVAAAITAKQANAANIISLDMGGTTLKTTIVEDGEPAKTTEYEVGAGINLSSKLIQGAGYAVKLPFIDVVEIGAGGGSMIWFDKGGMLQVGPQSAGSVPGPVCYAMGGEAATLTDALLALGFINPAYLVGGEVALDAAGSRAAIEQQIARRLGVTTIEAAHAVFTVAVSNMTRAVKAVSTYRGRDPREFALFAFGGNGPVVATAVAESLEMTHVIIPPSPGVFSAVGLLLANVEHVFVQTLFGRLRETSTARMTRAFDELMAGAVEILTGDGIDRDAIELLPFMDLRYHRQAFELTIPVAYAPGRALDPDAIEAAFHAEHKRTYGHMSTTDPVELVNVRLVARAGGEKVGRKRLLAARRDGVAARDDTERLLYFGPTIGEVRAKIMTRHALAGAGRPGPIVVQEYDSTTIVPPGWVAHLDDASNINLRPE